MQFVGSIVLSLLSVYGSVWILATCIEKRERKRIKNLQNKYFKSFSKTKSFEDGSYVLRINYELNDGCNLENQRIVRYFSNMDARFKSLQYIESENKWLDTSGLKVDESYFKQFLFVLDTTKKEFVYKAETESSLDELWNKIANNIKFWECVDRSVITDKGVLSL